MRLSLTLLWACWLRNADFGLSFAEPAPNRISIPKTHGFGMRKTAQKLAEYGDFGGRWRHGFRYDSILPAFGQMAAKSRRNTPAEADKPLGSISWSISQRVNQPLGRQCCLAFDKSHRPMKRPPDRSS
jgi:hypothetical protein